MTSETGRTFDLLGALWSAKQIQLHHHDLSAFVQLEIRNLEHWRALDGAGPGTWQLDDNLLRIGIQRNRSNFESWRELNVLIWNGTVMNTDARPCADGVS